MASLSLLLLAGLAFGQTVSEVTFLQDFSGGLNTNTPAVMLQDNESPDMLNVVLDKPGAVAKREGQTQLNDTAIGGGSSDVQSVYELLQTDGDRYCVAFSSTNGYFSTDGCTTFTSFVTSMTRNNDVNCDTYNDALYCGNNQYNMKFDGAADSSFTTNPANIDFIRVHRNRCWAAGTDAAPYRLYWSALGNCDSWTVSTDYVDVCTDDGDSITGIGQTLFDALPVYCRFSTYVIKGAGPDTFTLVNLSRTTGAKSHRTIQNFENVQLFDSLGPNGGQPGVYANNGIVVKEASNKLRGSLDAFSHFTSATGRKIIDTKADFDAGTFDSMAMSSSRESGFMQSSHTTMTDTLTADFQAGTLTNVSTHVGNALTIRQGASAIFSSGGCQGSSLWTNGVCGTLDIAANWGSQHWRLTGVITSGAKTIQVQVLDSSGNQLASNTHAITDNQGWASYTFDTSAYTVSTVKIRLTVTGSQPTGTAESPLFVVGTSIVYAIADAETSVNDRVPAFDMDESVSVPTTGSIVSRIHDTAISTPTWGLFAATVSSDTNSRITFEVQSSTASDGGGFETLVAETLDTEVSAAQRRYIRYKASYTLNSATNTPASISDVTMTAASTGTWTSPVTFLSNSISAAGLFQCQQTTTGTEAAITYAWRTGATSAATSAAAYATITCGATLTSLNSYVQVLSTVTVGVATETAKIDNLVFNWSEGTVSRSPTSGVFKNRYHICGQDAAGAFNDTCYVLHSNGAWSKFASVRARSLGNVNQRFIVGDSTETTGGFLYQLYSGTSDDGAAINAYWESKDLNLGPIQNVKAVDRVFSATSNDPSTLTLTLKPNGGLSSDTYSIATSTNGSFGIWSTVIDTPRTGNTFRVRWGNNAASAPWSLYGLGLSFRDLGMLVP